MNLKQELLNAFQQVSEETFTVSQLLKIYMGRTSKIHSDSKSARQYIHRVVQRLIVGGDLMLHSTLGRKHIYVFTEQSSLFRNQANGEKIENLGSQVATEQKNLETELIERLNHQKRMLLTAMGEAEEYDAIYKDIPGVRPYVQHLYDEARDRCNKLLGKVKALENLINSACQI